MPKTKFKEEHPEFEAHDVSSISDPLDILAGPTNSEKIIEELAKIRNKLSVEELGNYAGSAVLDQLKAGSAAIETKPWQSPELLLATSYAALAAAAPLAGISAAVALDIAIFGGSAHDVTSVIPALWPLGFGSLVYGTGLGMFKGNRFKEVIVGSLTGAACFLAAFSIADNAAFKHHYASFFPDNLNNKSDLAAKALANAKAIVDLDKASVEKQTLYIKGDIKKGIPAMNNDGNPYNDKDEPAERVHLAELEKKLENSIAAEKTAASAATTTSRNNPVDRYTRWIAALAFFAPLMTSMLVFGHVLGNARKWFQEHKNKAELGKKFRSFVAGLKSPDLMRASATQEVTKMLMRFNPYLARGAKGNQEKLAHVDYLYSGDPYTEAREIGIDLVCGSLTGVDNWQRTAPGMHARTAEWRKNRFGIEPEAPQPAPAPEAATYDKAGTTEATAADKPDHESPEPTDKAANGEEGQATNKPVAPEGEPAAAGTPVEVEPHAGPTAEPSSAVPDTGNKSDINQAEASPAPTAESQSWTTNTAEPVDPHSAEDIAKKTVIDFAEPASHTPEAAADTDHQENPKTAAGNSTTAPTPQRPNGHLTIRIENGEVTLENELKGIKPDEPPKP